MSAKSSILLAYRQTDDSHTVQMIGRIADRLRKHFGSDTIVDGARVMQPGIDIAQTIERMMPRLSAVIVPIGPRWLEGTDGASNQRPLANPYDAARLQIEAALRYRIPIIPLLVGNDTKLPTMQLIPSLAPILGYASLTVREDPDFNADMGDVLAALGRWTKPLPPTAPSKSRHIATIVGLIVGLALFVGEIITATALSAINSAAGTSSSTPGDSSAFVSGLVVMFIVILGAYILAGMIAARRTGLARTGSGAGIIAGAVSGGIVALCSGILLILSELSYRPSSGFFSGLGLAIGAVATIVSLVWLVLNLGLGAAFGAIGGTIGRRGYRGAS
jgi:hypothetical protein